MNPELHQIFVTNIILDLLIVPILAMLLVQVVHRKHKTPEITLFFRMCILNLVECFAYLAGLLALLYEHKLNETLVLILAVVCNALIGLTPLLLVVHWLLFVEYTLHQSMDIIRRRYPVVMIPFWIGVLIVIFGIIVPIPEWMPMSVQIFNFYLSRVGLFIWAFYIVASYGVLFAERKRRSIPQYIRITPTVICIAVGLLISVWTSYEVDALGYAIGLMFADYYMFRRLDNIDPGTGFFNEKYLKVLGQEAKKKNINEAMLIRFKTKGDEDKLAGILKYWEPEYCKIIKKDDGEFLIFSELQNKLVAERFVSLVRENCKKEGLETDASYEMIGVDADEKATGENDRKDF